MSRIHGSRPTCRTAILVLTVLLAGLGPGGLAAQYVHGVVTYVHTDAPVNGATVWVFDAAGRAQGGATTGSDGRFSIPVTRDGPVTVYVEHPSAWAMMDGPVNASYSENTMVLFALQPSPIALEGMHVEVEARPLTLARTGFYERRQVRPGVFLDPEVLNRRKPLATTDVLRSMPGVRILESREVGLGSFPIMSYAERTQLDPGLPPCFPRVVLDGLVVNTGGREGGPTNLDALVHPVNLQAVEVYRSPAEAPVEFGGGLAACGMIVLWTRAGGSGR
jgi:hypothetical protein